jgi:hypothetical protein
MHIETIDSSPKDIFTRYANNFGQEYRAVYPNANIAKTFHFSHLFSHLASGYDAISLGYKELCAHTETVWEESFFGGYILYWLLYDTSFTDFYGQLQTFIIEKNDVSLTLEDYILLFYAFSYNSKLNGPFSWIPLSTLRDIFTPLAEENLKKWKLAG